LNVASVSKMQMSKDKTSLLLRLSICLLVLVLLVQLASTSSVVALSEEWAEYLLSASAEPDEKDPPSGDVDCLLSTLPFLAPLKPTYLYTNWTQAIVSVGLFAFQQRGPPQLSPKS
jgi:hypothetical protein